MSAFLLGWFRLIWLFARGHQALVLENLALRQQLAVYKRQSKRPRLRHSDRMFWITLAGLWKGWRRALVLVHPSIRTKALSSARFSWAVREHRGVRRQSWVVRTKTLEHDSLLTAGGTTRSTTHRYGFCFQP